MKMFIIPKFVFRAMYIRLLLLCCLSQFCMLSGATISTRTKRVIQGTQVLDLQSEYRSLKFFVWMAVAHLCEFRWLSFSCVITTQYNFCGGSLLTPKLVQTACHCLAYFTTEKDGFKSAVTKDVFENELMVYPGIVPPDIVDGVKSEKFFSHPKCKQYTSSKLALHDYGLIVLASELFERRVVPAPVYTIRTLTRVWTETMAKEAACLLLGYGRYRLLDDDHEDPTLPNVILHGWVRSMPYRDCYLYTTSDYTDAKKKWNYTDEATYFCMEALPTFNQYQGGGDSGGPVSCNNQYAGIVSYVRYKDKPRALQVSAAMSTAFSVYENSAEYRKSMLEANLGQDHLSKFDNIRPTSQPLHQYFYDRF